MAHIRNIKQETNQFNEGITGDSEQRAERHCESIDLQIEGQLLYTFDDDGAGVNDEQSNSPPDEAKNFFDDSLGPRPGPYFVGRGLVRTPGESKERLREQQLPEKGNYEE